MKITLDHFPGGKAKALTMSYDDSHIQNRRLVNIFNHYGIKGTFHLNTGFLDTEPYLHSSEITGLFEGHELSVHTVSHPRLTSVPNETIVEEIMEDRKKLEQLAGYPVRGMSYPYGNYNKYLLQTLPMLGIEYSRTVNSHGSFQLPENFLCWHPTCHHNDSLLERCDAFLNEKKKQMHLFYVWGHSFEFEKNNNWDLIETFCEKISDDETVWYATNIEIVDYLQALKQLRFSVDRKMIYNPSAISLWIGVDGQAMEIKPGKTINT